MKNVIYIRKKEKKYWKRAIGTDNADINCMYLKLSSTIV